MKILISPAKSLDFDNKALTEEFSQPQFLKSSEQLMKKLKKKSNKDLKALMKISDSLAALNVERNKNWKTPFDIDNAKQALYCFTGEVYRGIDVNSMDENDLNYTQDHLRILSGLYGILKPLDLIQPYRLEMGTKLQVEKDVNNLYQFWNESITEHLNKELKNSNEKTIVNLASNEYYKVIKEKLLNAQVITPVFKDFKNGEYKVIMTYAKFARGLMTRYIIKNKIDSPEKIKLFDMEGYSYDDNLSDGNNWVFTR